MIRSEMLANSRRKFIPNSYKNDHEVVEAPVDTSAVWMTAAGVAVGSLALLKYPKTTLSAGLLIAAYFFAKDRSENPIRGEGLVKNVKKYTGQS